MSGSNGITDQLVAASVELMDTNDSSISSSPPALRLTVKSSTSNKQLANKSMSSGMT